MLSVISKEGHYNENDDLEVPSALRYCQYLNIALVPS